MILVERELRNGHDDFERTDFDVLWDAVSVVLAFAGCTCAVAFAHSVQKNTISSVVSGGVADVENECRCVIDIMIHQTTSKANFTSTSIEAERERGRRVGD